MLKALLIDAQNEIIREIEIENGFQHTAKAIGGGCTTIELVSIARNEDSLYVDEDGLAHVVPNETKGFHYTAEDGTLFTIVGNGVMLGSNEEGESVDVKMDAVELAERVVWMDAALTTEYALN